MKIIEVTPENALQETFFCVKDFISISLNGLKN